MDHRLVKKNKLLMLIFILLFVLSCFVNLFLLLQPNFSIYSLIPFFAIIIFFICCLKQIKILNHRLKIALKCVFVTFLIIVILINAIVQFFHVCKTEIIIDEFEITEISEDELSKIKNESNIYNYFNGYKISKQNIDLIESHKNEFVSVSISAYTKNNYSYPVYINRIASIGKVFPYFFYPQKLENNDGWLMPEETKEIYFSIIIDKHIFTNDDKNFYEFVKEGLDKLTFFVW